MKDEGNSIKNIQLRTLLTPRCWVSPDLIGLCCGCGCGCYYCTGLEPFDVVVGVEVLYFFVGVARTAIIATVHLILQVTYYRGTLQNNGLWRHSSNKTPGLSYTCLGCTHRSCRSCKLLLLSIPKLLLGTLSTVPTHLFILIFIRTILGSKYHSPLVSDQLNMPSYFQYSGVCPQNC